MTLATHLLVEPMPSVVLLVGMLAGLFAPVPLDISEILRLTAEEENVKPTLSVLHSKSVKTSTVSTHAQKLVAPMPNAMSETMSPHALALQATPEIQQLTAEDMIQMSFVSPVPVEGILIAEWKITEPFAVVNPHTSEILSPDANMNAKATTIVPATKDAKTLSVETHAPMLAERMLHVKLPITELFAHAQKITSEIHTPNVSQNVLHMLIVLQTGHALD